MHRNRGQTTDAPVHRRLAHPSLLVRCALATTALLWICAVPPARATPSGTAEAERLRSSLTWIAKLASRRVRPPALHLTQSLPGGAERLEALREPAAATRAQVETTLEELRRMSAPATLDPHYLPALVAAGGAFVAVSGQDPLTRTTINPDYLGLEPELGASAVWLRSAAADAGELSSRVKRLTRALINSRRRATRLERELRSLHGNTGAPRR